MNNLELTIEILNLKIELSDLKKEIQQLKQSPRLSSCDGIVHIGDYTPDSSFGSEPKELTVSEEYIPDRKSSTSDEKLPIVKNWKKKLTRKGKKK